MAESPTGRGYVQGSSSYSAADMARMDREEKELARRRAQPVCTCKGSPFGMDVDRCPVHGNGADGTGSSSVE